MLLGPSHVPQIQRCLLNSGVQSLRMQLGLSKGQSSLNEVFGAGPNPTAPCPCKERRAGPGYTQKAGKGRGASVSQADRLQKKPTQTIPAREPQPPELWGKPVLLLRPHSCDTVMVAPQTAHLCTLTLMTVLPLPGASPTFISKPTDNAMASCVPAVPGCLPLPRPSIPLPFGKNGK